MTFNTHESAKYAASVDHSIQGKPFGCSLIKPNKEAKNVLNDKKNRKLYIKVTDKHRLTYEGISTVFSQYGEIEEITILKESKEKSGFVLFFEKESVDIVLSSQPIESNDGFIYCEPCLTRKEIKKSKVSSNQGPYGQTMGSFSLSPGIPDERIKGISPLQNLANDRQRRGSKTFKDLTINPDPVYNHSMVVSLTDFMNQSPGAFQNTSYGPEYWGDGSSRYIGEPYRQESPLNESLRQKQKPLIQKEQRNIYKIEVNQVTNEAAGNAIRSNLLPFLDDEQGDEQNNNSTLLFPVQRNKMDSNSVIGGASAVQLKDEGSRGGGFSRSPRNNSEEDYGRNFLNIPFHNKDTHFKGLSDKGRNEKERIFMKTGSVEESLLQSQGVLFPPETKDVSGQNVSNKDLLNNKKANSSKQEMLGSRSVASIEPVEEDQEKYRLNLPIILDRHNSRTKSFDEGTKQEDKRRLSLEAEFLDSSYLVQNKTEFLQPSQKDSPRKSFEFS